MSQRLADIGVLVGYMVEKLDRLADDVATLRTDVDCITGLLVTSDAGDLVEEARRVIEE